jgi:hypothetical protein
MTRAPRARTAVLALVLAAVLAVAAATPSARVGGTPRGAGHIAGKAAR